MKKTYINPEMQVVKIEYQQMLTTSGPVAGGSTNDENDLLGREFVDDDNF